MNVTNEMKDYVRMKLKQNMAGKIKAKESMMPKPLQKKINAYHIKRKERDAAYKKIHDLDAVCNAMTKDMDKLCPKGYYVTRFGSEFCLKWRDDSTRSQEIEIMARLSMGADFKDIDILIASVMK